MLNFKTTNSSKSRLKVMNGEPKWVGVHIKCIHSVADIIGPRSKLLFSMNRYSNCDAQWKSFVQSTDDLTFTSLKIVRIVEYL